MDVLSVENEQADFSEVEITEEDEQEILEMSKDENLAENIVKSIAPTIYGMDDEKMAVALQLFGGSHKVLDDGTSIRGDIHILMIGDPGVAKSQILRYMSDLSPRGIYASGKSASAAGLCVHGDTILSMEKGTVKIADYVNSHMTAPEEYRPGIWRQAVSGDRVDILNLDVLGHPEPVNGPVLTTMTLSPERGSVSAPTVSPMIFAAMVFPPMKRRRSLSDHGYSPIVLFVRSI